MARSNPGPPSAQELKQQWQSRTKQYAWDKDMNVILSSQSSIKKKKKEQQITENAAAYDGYVPRGPIRV